MHLVVRKERRAVCRGSRSCGCSSKPLDQRFRVAHDGHSGSDLVDSLGRGLRGHPLVAEVPDGHAGEVAEDDAPDVARGRRHARGAKLSQVGPNHRRETVGIVKKNVAAGLTVGATHEDRIDDG